MNRHDTAIILSLVFCVTLTAIASLCADIQMGELEARIDAICNAQDKTDKEIEYIKYVNAEQEERIASIEEIDKIQNARLAMHRDELIDNTQMFSDLLGSVEHMEEYMRSLPDNALGVKVSDKDIRDISALVYLEAGGQGCSYRLKKAIASVIFNRMIRYNMTAQQVIYERGVFSPANRVKSTTPSSSCIMAVREVLENGCTLPVRVTAFRMGYYHNFGSRYCVIDNVYFTLV